MNFSQRIGLVPSSKSIQLKSMDDDLKVGLWNIFSITILSNFAEYADDSRNRFSSLLWHEFFKKQIESVPYGFSRLSDTLNKWFFHPHTNWNEIYDFLEYAASICNEKNEIDFFDIEDFYATSNIVLEREFSAYRFIDGVLSPISNEHEKLEIELALNNTSGFSYLLGCNVHLSHALKLLSDKVKPDYRNSIKESISAVESVAKIISGKTKATLGSALSVLKSKITLHPALEEGFSKIYGYTSDSNGIRHASIDEPNCDFDDAKYMLVSCSAFVNYLISKSQKAGIALK